jgi:UDP-N-acetylmuramoylalanine-D-glutamate ligase
LAIAKKNDLSVILFSPWAASFDLFANVYARIGEWERQVGTRLALS